MNQLSIWLRTLEQERRNKYLLKAYRTSKVIKDEAVNTNAIILEYRKTQKENRDKMVS